MQSENLPLDFAYGKMDGVRFEEELVSSLRIVIGERQNRLPIELSVGRSRDLFAERN